MDKLIDLFWKIFESKKRPVVVWILVIVGVVGIYAWYNWDHVKELPGIAQVADFVEHHWPLPTPDKSKLSIGIVHLNGDDDGRFATDIVEDLNDIQPVQITMIDRIIETTDPNEGRKRVHDLLRQSGFDVIIWGTILKDAGDKAVTKLYWTTSADRAGSELAPTRIAFDDDRLQLPPVAWRYLNTVLGLVVTTAAADLLGSDQGHYIVDKLAPFIKRTRSFVDRVSQMDSATHAELSVLLSDALTTLGEQSGNNAVLVEAVRRYNTALKESYSRERVPHDWARTQNNLGTALSTLGERESGTARLQEAVTAYQKALLEDTRNRDPLDWARTQNNLGTALWTLGERESGTAHLEEAVTAYQDALLERTRDRVPLDYAATQSNLGNALRMLGERESGTARLQEAVTAYQKALLEDRRDRDPLDWAGTQNNLGNALWTLGQRESGTARLEEAVKAFQNALLERTRDRVPLDWAMTQNNLGDALTILGMRESGTTLLEEAVKPSRTRYSNARAIAFRWTGRRPKTISATPYRSSGCASPGRRASKRPSPPTRMRCSNAPASVTRSAGRRVNVTLQMRAV
jgi:tetratricopeptide (TPR) repeat protein